MNIATQCGLSQLAQHNIKMIKTKKYLRFERLQLVVQSEHPKDISRAQLRVLDGERAFKTFRYGAVEPRKILWDSEIELPYEGQESLQFETICEHEFGYQIEELRALYRGIIYVRPDQFYFESTAHCFSREGVQCGVLKYMIKVIEREESRKQEKVEQRQPIKVSLLARLSIYAATLSIHPYYLQQFQRKTHRKLKLELRFKGSIAGAPKFSPSEYRWLFSARLEVSEGDPESIELLITQDDKPFLSGSLEMAALEERKRFSVQMTQLYDQSGANLACLHLDMRFVSKRELLDLMYSPKQLGDSKRQEEPHFQSKKRTSSALDRLPAAHKISPPPHSPMKKLSQRYQASLFTDQHQSSIPRSKRFSQPKDVNQHVSYIDPALLSDFAVSPRRKKGSTQSSSHKIDFTRGFRDNPGVGEYQLPSIWQKK